MECLQCFCNFLCDFIVLLKENSEWLCAIALKDKKVIDSKNKIKDTMKAQLAAGTLNLSERWSKAAQRAILQSMNKADNKLNIRDASKDVTVKLNKRALLSPEFMELWNKIKQKTTYRVQFDLEKLIADSIKDIREMPEIASARLLSQTASVDIQKSGVTAQAGAMFTQNLEKSYNVLPDILRLISTKTLLKRSTVNKIIQESGRAGDFLKNPQDFYEKVLEIIQRNRHALAIDGITLSDCRGAICFAFIGVKRLHFMR